MTLIRRIRDTTRLIRKQQALIDEQHELLGEVARASAITIYRHQLEHLREQQGIVSAWLIHLEQPEIDLRHDLNDLAGRLADQIAELEEHIV